MISSAVEVVSGGRPARIVQDSADGKVERAACAALEVIENHRRVLRVRDPGQPRENLFPCFVGMSIQKSVSSAARIDDRQHCRESSQPCGAIIVALGSA